jgi:hypothetical protein
MKANCFLFVFVIFLILTSPEYVQCHEILPDEFLDIHGVLRNPNSIPSPPNLHLLIANLFKYPQATYPLQRSFRVVFCSEKEIFELDSFILLRC